MCHVSPPLQGTIMIMHILFHSTPDLIGLVFPVLLFFCWFVLRSMVHAWPDVDKTRKVKGTEVVNGGRSLFFFVNRTNM